MLYNKLAVCKQHDDSPVFVFLDKQCLNLGQEWQDEFLNGLKSSEVIVLFISTKVCICNEKLCHFNAFCRHWLGLPKMHILDKIMYCLSIYYIFY